MTTGYSELVSVILATYNSSGFLHRSVSSVLRQTYPHTELIIVDDGSIDNTFNFLLPVMKENENIRYLRHSNRGHPLSLNAGIRIADGRYISLLDADDEYSEQHIQLRVEHLRETGDDLLHSPATHDGKEEDFLIPDANDISRMIHINECVIGGTFFGKKEVFDELRGFADVYSHDSDFLRRANDKFSVARFEHPTYIYHRDNPYSITNSLKQDAKR